MLGDGDVDVTRRGAVVSFTLALLAWRFPHFHISLVVAVIGLGQSGAVQTVEGYTAESVF